MADVLKAGGRTEPFDRDKLCRSLIKSGAADEVAHKICYAVAGDITPNTSTGKIWRMTLKQLAQVDVKASARYSLRRGMAHLGPDGFVFEKFVEVLLGAYGYETRRNRMLIGGSGLQHETDVEASRGGMHAFIEAKYKNEYGLRTHINDVMYAHARFKDIVEKIKKDNPSDPVKYEQWVVTNTEFTDSCIKYAEHVGMRLLGWNYPVDGALEDLIMQEKVYPLTILPSVTRADRTKFFKEGLMLAQDLLPYSSRDLEKQFGISPKRSRFIVEEAQSLLGSE